MSTLIDEPTDQDPNWQQAASFRWCHDNGGITVEQYEIGSDGMVYRHFDTVAEFTATTQTSVSAA